MYVNTIDSYKHLILNTFGIINSCYQMTKELTSSVIGGYGQPFYAPFWWPVSNMITAFVRNTKEIPGKPTSLPSMPLNDHLAAMTSSLRNFILGYLAVYWLYDEERKYPAYGDAKEFSFIWMLPIILRNVVGTISSQIIINFTNTV